MIDVHKDVAELLRLDPRQLDPEENLIARGLYSLAMMRLIAAWTRQGAPVRFGDVAGTPTIRAWQELVDEAAAAVPASPGTGPSAGAAKKAFRLGTMQHAYWLGRSMEHALGGVAAHGYVEFKVERFDPERFAAALRGIVERHQTLRTAVDDLGMQRVLESSPSSDLAVADLRGIGSECVKREIDSTREEMAGQLLDIGAGQMIDARASLLEGGSAILHMDLDIIAADAVSFRTLLRELAIRYERPEAPLPPIGYDYADYLEQKRQAVRLVRAADERYWSDRLSQLPPPPQLPNRAGGPAPRPGQTSRRLLRIDPDQRRRFDRRARDAQLTPAALHATLLSAVIARWSGARRFLLNVPLFNRKPLHPDVELLVGDFSSSVLVSVDMGKPENLAAAARELQRELYEAAAHSDFEGVEVMRMLGQREGGSVVCPIVFTCGIELGDLIGTEALTAFGMPVHGVTQGPQIMLDAQVMDQEGATLLSWDSRDGLLPDGMVDAMWRWQERLYDLVLAEDRGLEEVPLAEIFEEDVDHGPLEADPEAMPLLHEPLFDWARLEPDRPFLLSEEGTLVSYGQAAEHVLALAGGLVEQGVSPGDRVIVYLEKGIQQILSALAVLAAGAAYVPIGLGQPEARRELIAQAARARLCISAGAESWPCPRLAPGEASGKPLAEPVLLEPSGTAYIIYTSGSTGVPKGVEVSHRAVANTLRACNAASRIGAEDRTVAISSLDFDVSAHDMFAPLLVGGSIAVPSGDIRRDGLRLSELIERAGVTQVYAVPGILRALADARLAQPSHQRFGRVRTIMSGGDRIDAKLVEDLFAVFPGVRCFGLGGATETAIHHSLYEVLPDGPRDWASVPFGRPFRGNRFRVVDEYGAETPEWVSGELWVGGVGLADGYFGDETATADRFVERDGTRWWRSGDIVRRRPDGVVEFIGRRDNQVKIRGYRVDLAEVEGALAGAEWCREAAAAAFEAAGRTRVGLVAVPTGALPELGTLRRDLAHRLPEPMLPELIVEAASLPRTAEGKIDTTTVRRLLSTEYEHRIARRGGDSGKGDVLQRALARTFADVVGIERDRVELDADMFELGGDSIVVTRLVTELRRVLMLERIGVADVFESGSIRSLAVRVRAAYPEEGLLDALAETYLLAFEGKGDSEE